MQPWIDKTASHTSKGSIHYDHTLSHLQSSSSQFNTNETGSFRTFNKGKGKETFEYNEPQAHKPPQPFGNYQFTPIESNFNAFEEPLDGSDVLNFLNSGTAYSDLVHGDDLQPDSISYISHRHQMDTQHAMSEKEKLDYHWTAGLLAAEDIVEYLQNTSYTEDVYGIPIIGQWIKEAKQEAMQEPNQTTAESKQVAIERLNMIRQHLIQKANGDPNVAAKNAIEMTENDWSSAFS